MLFPWLNDSIEKRLPQKHKKPLATCQEKCAQQNVFQQKLNRFLVNLLAPRTLEQDLERTKEKLIDTFLSASLVKLPSAHLSKLSKLGKMDAWKGSL